MDHTRIRQSGPRGLSVADQKVRRQGCGVHLRARRQGDGRSKTPRCNSLYVKTVELGNHGKEYSFEAILRKYRLTNDPALVLLAKIVNAADTDNTLYHQPEGPGLEAIAEGFRHLGYKNDHEVNAAEWIVYDALYAYCQEMVRAGKPNGEFK